MNNLPTKCCAQCDCANCCAVGPKPHCRIPSCSCHQVPTEWERKEPLSDEDWWSLPAPTQQMDWDTRGDICQMTSEMLDNPKGNIYPTGRFYDRMENYINMRLTTQKKEVIEKIKELDSVYSPHLHSCHGSRRPKKEETLISLHDVLALIQSL